MDGLPSPEDCQREAIGECGHVSPMLCVNPVLGLSQAQVDAAIEWNEDTPIEREFNFFDCRTP